MWAKLLKCGNVCRIRSFQMTFHANLYCWSGTRKMEVMLLEAILWRDTLLTLLKNPLTLILKLFLYFMAVVTISNTGFFIISVCLLFLYFLLNYIFILNSKSLLPWDNDFLSTTDGKNTGQHRELRWVWNLLLLTLKPHIWNSFFLISMLARAPMTYRVQEWLWLKARWKRYHNRKDLSRSRCPYPSTQRKQAKPTQMLCLEEGKGIFKKKSQYEQNQGRNNYLNHKTEYLASKMLIQVLRDLINLFVEVKIKLSDSKCFPIKWNFQLPCETSGPHCHFAGKALPGSTVLWNISRWDLPTLPGGTGIRSFQPDGKAPAAAGVAHRRPTEAMLLVALLPGTTAHITPLLEITFASSAGLRVKVTPGPGEKSAPYWDKTGQGTKGDARTYPHLPTHFSSQPKTSPRSNRHFKPPRFSNKSIWKFSWGRHWERSAYRLLAVLNTSTNKQTNSEATAKGGAALAPTFLSTPCGIN